MNLQINEELIPGTILNRREMGDVTGLEFLKKIFYLLLLKMRTNMFRCLLSDVISHKMTGSVALSDKYQCILG